MRAFVIGFLAAALSATLVSQTQVANNAAELAGKIIMLADGGTNRTVTNLFTFDRDPSAPFAVSSGSAVVTNLDADKVDGVEASAFAVLADNETVSGTWTFSALPSDLLISTCDGRLTLTTATPVTTSDVTGATTIYFTPYKGNRCALYDGASWDLFAFTERSLALGTLTSGLNYDVFLYDNSGTLTLELTAWTNDTTRATALTLQNGVYVRTGATTRRYLGTLRTTSTTQTEDSFAKRFVWNYYNRVPRAMRVFEATNSWAYTTATWRQANGSTANQLAFVVGVAEVPVSVTVVSLSSNSTANIERNTGIGLSSTSAIATGSTTGTAVDAATNIVSATATLQTFPPVGYNYAVWLEYATATGAATWYGDNNAPTVYQAGISGWIEG